MLIGFPPCTHLAVSGARHFPQKQADGRQEDALDFFNRLWHAPIPKIALENSVGIISTRLVKPTQCIQPYEHGDEKQKKTCLWLKGLPNLEPTNVVGRGKMVTYGSGKTMSKWYADTAKLTPRSRSRERSKTSPGVAKAMAEQWAGDCRGGGGGGGGGGDAMGTASAGMCGLVCECVCVFVCALCGHAYSSALCLPVVCGRCWWWRLSWGRATGDGRRATATGDGRGVGRRPVHTQRQWQISDSCCCCIAIVLCFLQIYK